MSVSYRKYINTDENDRIEFLMINFDFFDGNDLLAKLFGENYDMVEDTKIDGIHYSIIKLYSESTEYNLVWHEDIGNYLYSTQQDNVTLDLLEYRLRSIVIKINHRLRN